MLSVEATLAGFLFRDGGDRSDDQGTDHGRANHQEDDEDVKQGLTFVV